MVHTSNPSFRIVNMELNYIQTFCVPPRTPDPISFYILGGTAVLNNFKVTVEFSVATTNTCEVQAVF
jgi:hypothetical protein